MILGLQSLMAIYRGHKIYLIDKMVHQYKIRYLQVQLAMTLSIDRSNLQPMFMIGNPILNLKMNELLS